MPVIDADGCPLWVEVEGPQEATFRNRHPITDSRCRPGGAFVTDQSS
jgi:hypothetical protein